MTDAQYQTVRAWCGKKFSWYPSLGNVEELLASLAQVEAAPAPVPQRDYCPEKLKPGGCQLHNLHCDYPNCNKPPAPPSGTQGDARDAARYQFLRQHTTGQADQRGRQEFVLPDPHPIGNIMKGSVAQHLDAAIDAAIAAQGAKT